MNTGRTSGPIPCVLVAGVGNVFFSDDGFGPAVVERLAGAEMPAGVEVGDYGIRGIHLAYRLLEERFAALILVDALPMGEPPGTLAVFEPEDLGDIAGGIDAHCMSPAVVQSCVSALGGSLPRVLVVGCEPATVQPGMALSEPVVAALDDAARLVLEIAGAGIQEVV